jgi:hypothetical protein
LISILRHQLLLFLPHICCDELNIGLLTNEEEEQVEQCFLSFFLFFSFDKFSSNFNKKNVTCTSPKEMMLKKKMKFA